MVIKKYKSVIHNLKIISKESKHTTRIVNHQGRLWEGERTNYNKARKQVTNGYSKILSINNYHEHKH